MVDYFCKCVHVRDQNNNENDLTFFESECKLQ